MQHGLTFRLVGQVVEKMSFKSRENEQMRMVKVAWLGGLYNFQCQSQEELDRFPEAGANVDVTGRLIAEPKKPPKFFADTIEVITPSKVQQPLTGGSKSTRASA